MKGKINKLLVANRGEIASRVFATCKELEIKTVAIYSQYDSQLSYVAEADEAVEIKGETLKETYLNIKNIISVAKSCKVDAIHPGYGFLSENTEFAQAVVDAGIIFVGPNAKNIQLMGNKSQSKIYLQPLGVPFIPGYFGSDQSKENLLKEGKKIGLPILIKAAAGGGGKGMKIVHDWASFDQLLDEAKREALKAFNDEYIMLEKYLLNPRHIEVQVFGDEFGNSRHFFERDCSVQRRHQKIIEEAPAPGLSDKQRESLYKDALKIVESMKYQNAGTMEFIMDESGTHYFLEMNTRLQVEHPVTECIAGLDLVKLQLLCSQKVEKPWDQLGAAAAARGHALEVRVYAEDTEQDFFPTAGTIDYIKYSSLKNVRYDFTYHQGDKITVNYDPMIGKIIVWAEDREEAIKKMVAALNETVILGVKTNIPFLIKCLKHGDFVAGKVSTSFINKNFPVLKSSPKDIPLAIAAFLVAQNYGHATNKTSSPTVDSWNLLSNFRNSP